MSVFSIIITFAFTGNIVFIQCLGWCPMLHPPKKTGSAIGSACAVVFVMTCSTLVSQVVGRYLLVGPVLSSFRIMCFVLMVTGFLFATERAVRRFWPALRLSLGASIPAVSANCAVLGTVFMSLKNDFSPAEGTLAGFASGLGFLLAVLLMSSIRERLDLENVPRALRGAPIAFITAGLISLGFVALDVALLSHIFG
ncbi:MAG: hypothetical protein JXD23_11380 [Spirochaetales bacterium]|nr:hypothetical protein [Spirochaetales bacterium]